MRPIPLSTRALLARGLRLAAVAALAVGVTIGPLQSASAAPGSELLGWGDNLNYQLGDGLPGRTSPGVVHGLRDVVQIDSGSGHTLALTRDGTLWGWGRNVFGQIGDGSTTNRPAPVKVPLAGVVSFSTGGGTSMAVTADGTVWAWGFNLFGQVG